MDLPAKPSSHNLFEVYLRLRPPAPGATSPTERVLTVEPPEDDAATATPSHVTLNPPADRRRAIEKFGFTQVFEEDASQLNVFHATEIASMVEGVLAPRGGEGTDAVVATLGVTGSGKTHTILGSKSQRGLTQLAMDVLFRSIGPNMLDQASLPLVLDSLQASDPSEAALASSRQFLEAVYADHSQAPRANSRAATPMTGDFSSSFMSPTPRRNLPMPSVIPQRPDVSSINVPCDTSAEYLIIVSMYEVHNDRIYDLLTPAIKNAATKEFRRRPLLFKSTELSPDRKVVAGLRKVVCSTYKEAILVLDAGLQERRVTGTGSNSVSSRSHGFFCFEVRKRVSTTNTKAGSWEGSKLTIVDLAGSERARDAKTQGATLVEAGKINESLMYLGQCLQTQSDAANSTKPNVVPYRQCKLTELLFSNSFPSTAYPHAPRRNPQKGVMIVTADPLGDFNATSQILRYSALAREVTVPRIPSIAATILSHVPQAGNPRPVSPVSLQQQQQQQQITQQTQQASQHHPRPFMPPGSTSYRNHTPPMSTDDRATMEIAALEIARLSDEIDQLRAEVDEQTDLKVTAEAHLLSMEDRLVDLEAAIREECAAEFEQRFMLEMARFKTSIALEQERNDEHWDRKVDLLERGLDNNAMLEPGEGDKENVLIEDLSQEVERLRRENGILKRELAGRSPTKRKPLEDREDFSPMTAGAGTASPAANSSLRNSANGVANLGRKLERMRVTSTAAGDAVRTASGTSMGGSPKKMRKMALRRSETMD